MRRTLTETLGSCEQRVSTYGRWSWSGECEQMSGSVSKHSMGAPIIVQNCRCSS